MEKHSDIRNRGFLATLREGLWIWLAAAAFAWIANAISPRGLSLTRNYFPNAAVEPRAAAIQTQPIPSKTTGTNDTLPGADAQIAARLASKGLKVVSAKEAEQLFHDPRFAQGQVVFLDARDDAHYEAGHIPGAYQFDHYRAPRFLPTVLPLCSVAEMILVYCKGGECEDSEFAAITLRDTGVKADKLVVFTPSNDVVDGLHGKPEQPHAFVNYIISLRLYQAGKLLPVDGTGAF